MITKSLKQVLGRYVRPDRCFIGLNDGNFSDLLLDPATISLTLDSFAISLLDRRIVGSDWLRQPTKISGPPFRYVFASIKGGVGRSTALSICAADLANKGGRVLVIDVDLEAPGLASILLSQDTMPEFGLVDLLVEQQFGEISKEFFTDCVGPSDLSIRGRIDVVPAFGRTSYKNPKDVVAKLARAYIETTDKKGNTISLFDTLDKIIDRITHTKDYDAILIDARAGLHETNAAALLGLGAYVFLFGLNEEQHFQGCRYLLGNIARRLGKSNFTCSQWLERLTFVQGKAARNKKDQQIFSERCEKILVELELVKNSLDESFISIPPSGQFKTIPWVAEGEITDEEVLPNQKNSRIVHVLESDAYRNFNPRDKGNLLSEKVYSEHYGELIKLISHNIPL